MLFSPEAQRVSELLRAGDLDEGAIRLWWLTRRDELNQHTPRAWLIGGGAFAVIQELARADVLYALMDAGHDVLMRCEHCGQTRTGSFTAHLRDGWPVCCRATMRIEHAVEAAVERALAPLGEVVGLARKLDAQLRTSPHGDPLRT